MTYVWCEHTNSSITNLSATQNFTQTFIPGSYIWKINCTDSSNNFGNSSQRSFSVTAPIVQSTSPSGGGGGGGGSSTQTYTATQEQSSKGYTKELKKNEKIKFTFFDEKTYQHTLTLNYVGNNFVNITIQSEPIKIILGVGQSIKLNLTSSDYYDFHVKLENIVNSKAKLTIQTIHEEIPKPSPITGKIVEEPEINNTQKEDEKDDEIHKKIGLLDFEIKKLQLIVGMLIITFIIVVSVLIRRKRKKK